MKGKKSKENRKDRKSLIVILIIIGIILIEICYMNIRNKKNKEDVNNSESNQIETTVNENTNESKVDEKELANYVETLPNKTFENKSVEISQKKEYEGLGVSINSIKGSAGDEDVEAEIKIENKSDNKEPREVVFVFYDEQGNEIGKLGKTIGEEETENIKLPAEFINAYRYEIVEGNFEEVNNEEK